ncbi:MAG: hypothetical protein CVV51_09220 [Spirochaetae bacterium HGW-Spirochaetae-7]|jgi:methyl-accepting chemotaxis protein|nr:MAG: hypothetical protein CVV51_09220 [Spirochaetae bacterium HGW-Spirochaetae-7]
MAISLRNKLLIVSGAPLLLALTLGTVLLLQSDQDRNRVRVAASGLQAMKQMSRLITEVQKERGIAYLYLSGAAAADGIMSTRNETSDAWDSARPVLSSPDLNKSVMPAIASAIANLPMLRKQIDERSVMNRAAYTMYNEITDTLIEQMVELSRTEAAEATRQLQTIVLLEKAKENAGRVQCLASSIYSLDLPILHQAILELVDANAGIAVNLANGSEGLEAEASIALSELGISSEWYTLQNAVIEILGKATVGNYGKNGLEFYKATASVSGLVQKIIDSVTTGAESWFESRAAALGRTMVLIGALVGISVFFVMVLTLLLLANIFKRLRVVSAGMESVSSGDADLTRVLESAIKDELGELAGFFNVFVGMLRGLLVRVKAEVGSLKEGMIRLSSNTEETAGAVRQITANIESLKLQAISQSSSVTQSSASTEQIARNIIKLYKLIEKQSDGVTTSSSSIEEMVANIQSVTANIERMGGYYEKLLGKSEAGRGAIETVVTQVREIDAQSENLQEANSLIAGIAAQTNLLAMNAAIEAAHAGEAGMGFAVVADEIRKLAENAAGQSKTISRSIKGIRDVIDAVVTSSGLSAKTFDEILEQIRILSRLEEEIKYAMQEQSTGSAQILDSLANINEVTAEVRQSAEEMQNDSNEVLLEMRRLLQLASELENGMTEMAAGADEIQRAAHDTNELTVAASRSVNSVAAETDQFKT